MSILLLVAISLFFTDPGPGTSVLPLIRLAEGPRGAALGEALTATVDDATALYWNCGRLGKIRDYALSFSHQIWYNGTNDELLHFALPANRGVLGFSLIYSATPGIEFWNEQNQPGDTFTAWNGILALGYGVPVAQKYFLGAGLKGCYENLYTGYGYGTAFDIGFAAEPFEFLKTGLALRNLGLMKYSRLETLPAELVLGLAWTASRLRLLLDGVYPYDRQFHLRLGIEYQPITELSLRAGYRTGPQDLNELGAFSGLTAGIGVNLTNLALDYSLSGYGKLGTVHRLGIRLNLPRYGHGSLRIRVIDALTRERIWGSIKLQGVREFIGETNRAGELLITGLVPGRLIIHTFRKDYQARTDTMFIIGDREQSAVIALQPVRYSMITGTIYDAITKKPVSGTVIYKGAVYGEQETDPDLGMYTIRNLPSGRYLISVRVPAPYIPQSCTLDLPPGQLIQRDFYLERRQ
ncbi:MAG: PorV/PorQ family protein [candidate division WOR-3 bacterium]